MVNTPSEKLFIKAYDEYFEAIFRFCYLKTRDRELAKDLAQDAFLKAWVYLKSGNPIENTRALLYKIAGNSVIDWYRKKKGESLDNMVEGGFDPIDTAIPIDEQQEIKIVMSKLKQLSNEDQDLIVWHYVEGLPASDIANIINQNKNVVSVRIHRAVVKLKEIL